MRGPFRYIAEERLATMSLASPWWRRLRPTVQAGPAVAQLGATIAPSEATRADRIVAVERALSKQHRVRTARHVLFGEPGLFSFEGPAAVTSAAGAFWTATLTEECAVLLVGSLKNAIGGVPPADYTPGVSPSIDPRPAVLALLQGQVSGSADELNFAAAWQDIVGMPQIAPFLELPPVRGIAEYRTRITGDALTVWRHPENVPIGPQGGAAVVGLLLGAPLWIEAA
jgi:hypothetical protein